MNDMVVSKPFFKTFVTPFGSSRNLIERKDCCIKDGAMKNCGVGH